MDLLEAKAIFKIQDKYGQAELDAFYGFEKNLLLQKLSDEATEDELNEAQEALSQLERAYSVLSVELTSPSAKPDKAEKEKKAAPAINPMIIGIGVGLLVAVGAYVFFLKPDSSPQTTPTSPISSNNSSQPAPTASNNQNPVIRGSDYDLSKKPQEEAMLKVLKNAKAEETHWNDLTQQQSILLPDNIASLMEEGQDYRKNDRYSQAQLAFENYITAIREHIKQYESYQSTFQRYDRVSAQWQELAQTNNYRFARHKHYTEQFQQVKDELQQGSLPSHSRAVLDQICFIYESYIKRGQVLAQQQKDYIKLRTQWEKNVLGSSYYTLTPAIEELLKTADNMPYYAEDFEYLQTQIYPRLLNHFNQHL